MGTIADHFQLQREQLNLLNEFYNCSQQTPIPQICGSGSTGLLSAEEEKLPLGYALVVVGLGLYISVYWM